MQVNELLRRLPSVDEVIRSEAGTAWCARHPRPYVLEAVRRAIESARKEILGGRDREIGLDELLQRAKGELGRLAPLSLRRVINATGVVIHTNLGRSALSVAALENITSVARGYSNLEYDIEAGARGRRYSHVRRLLREVTGAEDGIAVNNNAGAVLLCLSALARGREAVVSRGELVEIGGSFRIPEVMAASGALLREVGATNKTHRADYERAIGAETALLLKVHQSNFRIIGFSSEVSIGELVSIGRERGVPVMFDLGSGCLVDLKPLGIHIEPTVQEVVRAGADLVTFSGDKLLGGPQAGIIVGRSRYVELLQKHPLLRALRIDKLTLAALEATLKQYVEPERARAEIPTLRMLFEEPRAVRRRAGRIARGMRGIAGIEVRVTRDMACAGGGSLPEVALPTFAVALRHSALGPNGLEERLRRGDPPVIARIKDDALLLDARTVGEDEVSLLAECVKRSLGSL